MYKKSMSNLLLFFESLATIDSFLRINSSRPMAFPIPAALSSRSALSIEVDSRRRCLVSDQEDGGDPSRNCTIVA